MKNIKTSLIAVASVLTASQGAHAQSAGEGIDSNEIIVTAQRRETGISRTPVAVNVLSSDTLRERAITTETDFQTSLPGLTVRAGQTANTLIFSLRGQTVDANSSSRSSVLPYINEVQIGGGSSKGGASGTAFFDLASVQLLKGPQGTLFGRNSTGGAVLFETAKPTNEFGGFFSAAGGNYNLARFQGALNIPVLTDKVLLRVAANFESKDGYQYNELNNTRLGDTNRKDVRVSLTLAPSSELKNDFMFQYSKLDGTNVSAVAVDTWPPTADTAFVTGSLYYSPYLDTVFGPGSWSAYLDAHPGLNPEGLSAAAAQQAKDPYHVRLDSPNFIHTDGYIITNNTSYDLGEHTVLKAIIGYAHTSYDSAAEYDGSEYAIDNGTQVVGTLDQFSAELQLQGQTLNDQLKYVTGVYYSHEKEDAIGQTHVLELIPFIAGFNPRGEGVTTNKTVAAYAQGTLDLGEILGAQGVAITMGGRYSKEDVKFLHNGTDVWVVSPPPAGVTFTNPLKDSFNQFSWSLGLQYQASDDLFLFANSRRSFRSGGFNFYAPPVDEFGDQGGGGAEFREEQATDAEIGVKFKGRIGSAPIRANLTVYKMWIKNIQRSNFVSVFGQLAGITVNVPEAQIKGIELDGEIQPTSWLTAGGALNYTDAKFTKNVVSVPNNPSVNFGPYPDTPKWSGSFYTQVKVPVGKDFDLAVRGDFYAQSKAYYSSTAATLNPGAVNAGYHTIDLGVTLDDKARGWHLSGRVKNLTDERYAIGGVAYKSLLAMNTILPASPRTYQIEVGYKF